MIESEKRSSVRQPGTAAAEGLGAFAWKPEEMADHLIAFITAPSLEMAETIGRGLVERRLAACVNLIPKIVSIYRWRGEICRDQEVLLVIKTTAEVFGDLEKFVVSAHSYEVPELVAVRLEKGSEPYLRWIDDSCGRQTREDIS